MGAEFAFEFPSGLIVQRGLTEEALLALEPGLASRRRDVGTGWVWYELPDLEADGFCLPVQVSVFQGVVRSITFDLVYEGEVIEDFWDDWSEVRERTRARDLASWLRSRGLELGSHPWGEVWAAFDPRSGFGSGGVRFAD